MPLFTSGGPGLGLVSSGLGLVILVLVLRIWSCLHHWIASKTRYDDSAVRPNTVSLYSESRPTCKQLDKFTVVLEKYLTTVTFRTKN